MKHLSLIFFAMGITLLTPSAMRGSSGWDSKSYMIGLHANDYLEDEYRKPDSVFYFSVNSDLSGSSNGGPTTSLERTREQIHNQREEFRKQQPQFTHVDRQLAVQSYSAWQTDDFVRAANQARQQGRSVVDIENECLNSYDYYCLPAFCAFIKMLPHYRSHIKKLRASSIANKPPLDTLRRYWKKGMKALGFTWNYGDRGELIEKLYAEILKEEKEERQQQQQAQYEFQRKQENIYFVFHQEFEVLKHSSIDEWQQIQNINQDYGLDDNRYYEQRKQAFSSILMNGCEYDFKSYTLSTASIHLIRKLGTDIAEYQTCYGNQLQQVIHQECVDGIECVTSLPVTSVVYPYKESVVILFDSAREYNQAGAVDKATTVTTFCWSLLGYGKAIAHGAISGLVGAAQDMLEHPGQAILCAVAGEYVLAYQLSKIVYTVVDIGITYISDNERGKKEWDEYVAPVTQLIDTISNKEITIADGLKNATQFAVQWKAQGKLLKGLNNCCKIAKAKAVEFARHNPLATPEQYMTTPEGMLLQSTNNMQPPASGSGLKYARTSKFFMANEQEIVALASKAQQLMQPTAQILQAIGKEILHAPEKFFRHIFSAELVEKIFPMGKVKKTLSGFHHYIPEHLEKMGVKLLNSRTCNKTGLSIADVLCDGHLEADKTFFPISWSREKVISKIAESLQYLYKPPVIEGTRCILFGRTSEGIIIKTIVDLKLGNYITAYPDALENGLI